MEFIDQSQFPILDAQNSQNLVLDAQNSQNENLVFAQHFKSNAQTRNNENLNDYLSKTQRKFRDILLQFLSNSQEDIPNEISTSIEDKTSISNEEIQLSNDTFSDATQAICSISSTEAEEALQFLNIMIPFDDHLNFTMNPSLTCNFINRIIPRFDSKYHFTSILGTGSYGIVLGVTNISNDKKYALKIASSNARQKNDDAIEILMLNKMYDNNLPVTMIHHFANWTFVDPFGQTKKFMIYQMEQVDTTLMQLFRQYHGDDVSNRLDMTNEEIRVLIQDKTSLIWTKVKELILLLKEKEFVHGDFHFGNIGIILSPNENLKFKFFDTMFSYQTTSLSQKQKQFLMEIDIVQILRSAQMFDMLDIAKNVFRNHVKYLKMNSGLMQSLSKRRQYLKKMRSKMNVNEIELARMTKSMKTIIAKNQKERKRILSTIR
jgi:hypothetical protein